MDKQNRTSTDLNPTSGYFVGVDIYKNKINLAAVDFKWEKVRIEETSLI